MKRWIPIFLLIITIVFSGGCRRVITGRYYVNREEITSIVGDADSRHTIRTGRSRADDVHAELGLPVAEFERPRTDVYVGSPSFHWIFDPWPFVVMREAHGPAALRLDYDENGVLQRSETKVLPFTPDDVHPSEQLIDRTWPDLRDKK